MGNENQEEKQERKNDQIREMGSLNLNEGKDKHKIKLLTIIGEIEGHEAVSGNAKSTKYEHLLPMLAEVEDSEDAYLNESIYIERNGTILEEKGRFDET